jgi:hypothetical protein
VVVEDVLVALNVLVAMNALVVLNVLVALAEQYPSDAQQAAALQHSFVQQVSASGHEPLEQHCSKPGEEHTPTSGQQSPKIEHDHTLPLPSQHCCVIGSKHFSAPHCFSPNRQQPSDVQLSPSLQTPLVAEQQTSVAGS